MKRFWLVLLSLGLVLAFSASAMAVDVKFSGDFYAAGVYVDKVQVNSNRDGEFSNISTAFYYQRLRVETDFIVSPGLKLVTRFDALERIWGGARSNIYEGMDNYVSLFGDSAGSRAENENIAFDWAYIEYASPIGVFTVGYQPDGGWGTVFADNELNGVSVGKIGWALKKGGFTGRVQIAKILDLSNSAILPYNVTDSDIDKYSADIKYAWNGGEAGLRGFYWRSAVARPSLYFTSNVYGVIPYAKAKIGPVALQAEVDYYWGNAAAFEAGYGTDVKLQNIGVFLDAVADFKMFYAGGTFAYVSGDDPDTDNLEGGIAYGDYGIGLNGGKDWNPCLIMFNYDVVSKWVGGIYGKGTTYIGGPMTNAWFGQGRVGVRPIPALDIMASVSYAVPDTEWRDDYGDGKPIPGKTYGWEVDVTGTYKLTNNLSYMLGAGILFTGDYYKGANSHQEISIQNDYMLINKLTLTF